MPAAVTETVLAHALPLPAEGVPDWVHLLTKGAMKPVDGRKAILWDGRDLPLQGIGGEPKVLVDENHETFHHAHLGRPTPAKGWLLELQTRGAELWGRVEWTAQGRALIEDKAYRHVSPELMAEQKTGMVISITGLSLTNRPALPGLKPLTHAKEPAMETDKMLCQALGLPEGSEAATAIAAVTALCGERAAIAKQLGLAEDAAPKELTAKVQALVQGTAAGTEALTSMQTEIVTLTKQVATFHRAASEAFVDAAIKQGRVGVKPLRDHYVARHMADAATVAKEFTALPVLQPGAAPPAALPEDAGGLTPAELTVARLMGQDQEAMKKAKAALALQEVL